MKTMMQDSKRRGRPPKARPEAEQVFPALGMNALGTVAPKKLEPDLPTVSCADCPHHMDKAKRCYGLTRDAKMGSDGAMIYDFYWCHRIGRKVNPMKDWIASQPQGTPSKHVTIQAPKTNWAELLEAKRHDEEPKGEESVTQKPEAVEDKPGIVHEEPAIVQAATTEDPAKEAGMLSRVLEDLGYQRTLAEEQVDTLKSSLEAAHEVLGVIDRAIQALEAVRTLQSLTASRGD